MNNLSSFVSRFMVLSLALAFVGSTAACANIVVTSGGGSSGSDGTGDPDIAICPTDEASPASIAISEGDLYPDEGDLGAFADTLVLQVGTGELSCQNPQNDLEPHGWSMSIYLPPELQHPGSFSLKYGEDDIRGFSDECSGDDGQGNCTLASGGTLLHGTLTIVEIDDKHVTFTVSGTHDDSLHFSADGTYTAPRCSK